MVDQIIHHLIIKPESAVTACGKEIISYYPSSKTAMLETAGQEPIRVTVGVKGVSCKECKELLPKLRVATEV